MRESYVAARGKSMKAELVTAENLVAGAFDVSLNEGREPVVSGDGHESP